MDIDLKILQTEIESIPYITPSYASKLSKAGITTIIDLLFNLPFNMVSRKMCNSIVSLQAKEHAIIVLTPIKYSFSYKKTTVTCADEENNYIDLVFFSVPKYLKSYLPLNSKVLIVGAPEYSKLNLAFNHPKILNINKMDTIKLTEPIYRAIDGITSAKLQQFTSHALRVLNSIITISEWLDETYVKTNQLPSFKEALNNIHNPTSIIDILPDSKNVTRLAIDEILAYHYCLMASKQNKANEGIAITSNNSLIKPFMGNLPFKLTLDQINAVKVLKQKLSSNNKENILLQGDVGSGKTIVCFIAALFAVESGYQVAFLAPTDILANQHYRNFINYSNNLGLSIHLLTGKTKLKDKNNIYKDLIANKINILVGTHAIFQQKVNFANLGLAIIDEQHRFGVNQRLSLSNKGSNPNVILTTATPIPRTLALSYYGDIESIEIKEKPSNRKEIITKTISKSKLDELIHSLAKSLKNNEKVFWVCPLIEESEKLNLTSAIKTFDYLKTYFNNYTILLVHGKLNSIEKDGVLQQFKELKGGAILVSTTVIEVGIDIPSCNIMVIENAQRFGLSQLHQLRGRVGRGEDQGICLLLYDDNITQNAKERLKVIKNSNDGFYIAQKDLELRGFGDVLGLQQSGFEFFAVVNLTYHAEYLIPTINYAKYLINLNSTDNRIVKIKIEALEAIFFKYYNNYIKVG